MSENNYCHCGSCGASMAVGSNSQVFICERCGSLNFLPTVLPDIARAFLLIEDGEYEQANKHLEKALDVRPTDAAPYVGKLMIERDVRRFQDLASSYYPLNNSMYYEKIIRFSGSVPGLKNKITEFNRMSLERNAIQRHNAKIFNQQAAIQQRKNNRRDAIKKIIIVAVIIIVVGLIIFIAIPYFSSWGIEGVYKMLLGI